MESGQLIIAIAGPTASGKSALAMELAKKFNGEIICADSRTIYRGMDLGTAKPSAIDRQEVAHHCLDLVNPDEAYSVANFKKEADKSLREVISRGRTPFIVGGSGLYIDAILYDFEFTDYARSEVIGLSLAELQEIALWRGFKPSAETWTNQRHLAGFIRRNGVQHQKSKLSSNVLFLGLNCSIELLSERIERRVEAMFEDGLVDEVKSLLKKWDKNAPGFLTPGYIPIIEYVDGKISIDEAKRLFILRDRQLAKRQMTWFKRNKDIQWVANQEEAEQIIKEKL